MHINFGSSFIIDKSRSNDAAPTEDNVFATVEQVVDHIDRAVEVAGIDHIELDQTLMVLATPYQLV
ncbi:MAG: hypothetical protein CM15mP107_5130 [Bacteroidota bacterium]|nr:MAG: hypothetical protein CM15mP107_5130 [Bacteroidota bacterium]